MLQVEAEACDHSEVNHVALVHQDKQVVTALVSLVMLHHPQPGIIQIVNIRDSTLSASKTK